MADSKEQTVSLPKPLLRRMMAAGKKRKPRVFGKDMVALACEEFLKAEKAKK